MGNTIHYTKRPRLDYSRVNSALKGLTTLSSDSGERIIEALLDYSSLSFIDLLIGTGLEQEALEYQLETMVKFGVLRIQTTYYQPEYQLNHNKLVRIMRLARRLAA